MISLSVSLSAGNPNEGDIGQILTCALTQNSTPYDLSTASTVSLSILDPAGNIMTRGATITLPATSGVVTYSFVVGDISIAGKYTVQAIVQLSSGNQYSTTLAYFRAGGVMTSGTNPGVAFIGLAPILSGNSSTSLTIQQGTITLMVPTGMSLAVGQYVNVIYSSDETIWMEGPILSYNVQTGQLQVNVINKNGSGTYSNWLVTISSAYSAGSALATTISVNNVANTLTFTGNYSLGLTLTGNTSLTLPISGTLATTVNLSSYAPLASPAFTGTIILGITPSVVQWSSIGNNQMNIEIDESYLYFKWRDASGNMRCIQLTVPDSGGTRTI